MTQKSREPLVIDTSSIGKRFGKTAALAGLELAVPEGAVYLLVGPNGAGKTSAIRLLLGQLRADSGRATVFGLDPKSEGATIRASVGYVPENGIPIYGWMSVRGLLRYHASYFANWDDEYAGRLIEALEVRVRVRFGKLSKGEKRRVQLVMALAHRPRLLLLDEPTDGLDPVIRDRFFGLLADHLAATPTSVLISSHLVYESEMFADHLGVLKAGRLTAQLDRETIKQNLRRYVSELPRDESVIADIAGSVIARRDTGNETDWVVWGKESAVNEVLWRAGAKTRDIKGLTLEEVARVLMDREEVTA
jgi:ABC-2 type transport system ATP-binding protein